MKTIREITFVGLVTEFNHDQNTECTERRQVTFLVLTDQQTLVLKGVGEPLGGQAL